MRKKLCSLWVCALSLSHRFPKFSSCLPEQADRHRCAHCPTICCLHIGQPPPSGIHEVLASACSLSSRYWSLHLSLARLKGSCAPLGQFQLKQATGLQYYCRTTSTEQKTKEEDAKNTTVLQGLQFSLSSAVFCMLVQQRLEVQSSCGTVLLAYCFPLGRLVFFFSFGEGK